MKPWGLDSYRSPRLTIDEVVLDPSRNQPMITKGSRAYEIAVNGLGPDTGTVVDFLHRLRDPAWEGWQELCANREDSPWQELTRQMDSYGLLMDDDSWGVTAAETENAALAKMVDEVDAWLARAAELAPAARFHRLGERLLHDASGLLSGFVVESFPEMAREPVSPEAVPLPRDEPNFYQRALLYALRYWRRAAPLSLACAVEALDRRFPGVAGSTPGPLAREVRARLAGGVYDLQDVQAHLNSLAVLLLLGASPDSARVCTLPESVAHQPRPALNLMIEAEHRAIEWLETLGLSRYQQALEEGRAVRRLAEGTYLHQYHVSRRFVEVITPMLLKRLRSPLRTKLFEYFGEELGHEEFELAACRSLGMNTANVEASIPLPLFSVYLEVLSILAEVDPVGFLLSILVTEGLPGTHTPVNSIFETHGIVTEPEDGEAIHQHEELNLTLDHSTMGRRLTLEVPSVPPAAQHMALDHFAFMLELNNRAWNMLHDYSVDETLPSCPGWLGVSPDQVWTWAARAELDSPLLS